MSLKLAQITAPRTTPVKLYETDEKGVQQELVLNIRHKRLTPTLARQVDAITNSIATESSANREENPKTKGSKKDGIAPPPPRNATVEQLALLVEYTDILGDDGKILPPTRETFELLSADVLFAMAEAITNSVIPEKKSSAG
ncbi:MAG: hypothetical protein LC768_13605 [Acidobacteria bacterium]|nr:hypothetical protein [Acidobacteriota bacterium]MCA1639346.1 hypothetical protein [Acidobacteriota bacterium]